MTISTTMSGAPKAVQPSTRVFTATGTADVAANPALRRSWGRCGGGRRRSFLQSAASRAGRRWLVAPQRHHFYAPATSTCTRNVDLMLKCDDTAISLFFAPFDLVGSRKSSAGVIARQPDLDIITRFARWETRKFQRKLEKRGGRARARRSRALSAK